jgi:hypothetical protein
MLLMESARREGVQYVAKFGTYEMYEVATAMTDECQRRQSQRDVVLAQCIKSQLLIWRPVGDSLQLVEEQQWAKRFPRLPQHMGLQDNWVHQRNNHMALGKGIPPIPDWSQLDGEFDEHPFPVEDPADDECIQISDTVLAELTPDSGAVAKNTSAGRGLPGFG